VISSISNVFAKAFGSRNSRTIIRYKKIIELVNSFEKDFELKTDAQITQESQLVAVQVKSGEKSLDDILPIAFALGREAAKRSIGLRPFDVQIMGAIALHEGNISEMKTGEGKTLVATMPAYLNALTGKSVHIVTVNDYLAERDAQWMSPVYELLGMNASVIKSGMTLEEKGKAYQSEIIYGTNNEFGFDYLRDNLVQRKEDQVQGQLSFAIVDEVDSILIDEARTPLIISGRSSIQVDLYEQINDIAKNLSKYDPPEGKQDIEIEASTVMVEGAIEVTSLEAAIDLAKSKNSHLVETKVMKKWKTCLRAISS
jgi:preprotein translocase subunit SecA